MYTCTSRSNGVSALLNPAASRVVEIYAKNKSRSVGEWMKSTAKTGCAVGCLLHCTFFMSCVLLQNTHTQNCNPLAPATRRNSGSRWRIEDRLSVLPSLITPDVDIRCQPTMIMAQGGPTHSKKFTVKYQAVQELEWKRTPLVKFKKQDWKWTDTTDSIILPYIYC